ncbi:MAG: RsmB/NOP family class I SAM-dependent RNA methyltransferase [Eubacteriales bacterium]|nr:RsmB/NOP family class I SAM-dependent RNA methyltransferase [Eubacteriales bacterium]
MTQLPQEFLDKMVKLLDEKEYEAFLASYEQQRQFGLRVNTAKISTEEFEKCSGFHLKKIPWTENGYYYEAEDAPARHPFYSAGLYYLQEPSAMTPASRLPVQPGMRVLDLCAAPGGKATELGARLKGQGLLVANDISASRARALLKNIEVFGIPNAFVTNEVPIRLSEQFPEFFNAVLVDAPCSGEGMFRKDPAVAKVWNPEKSLECAASQKEIAHRAALMLAPGGWMLYSTCTFSVEENEEVILDLLEKHPELHLEEIRPYYEGFSSGLLGLEKCVRIWPHHMNGEGHFLALLKKDGDSSARWGTEASAGQGEEQAAAYESSGDTENQSFEYSGKAEKEDSRREKRGKKERSKKERGRKERGGSYGSGRGNDRGNGRGNSRMSAAESAKDGAALEEFLADVRKPIDRSDIEVRKGQVYLVPRDTADVKGIPFLRNGLYLGEIRKERFEPSQSFAMALRAEEYASTIDLEASDERIRRYLHGETIELEDEMIDQLPRSNGWQLICVGGYPIGWGKLTGGLLKNKYHPGWRLK